jgi:hypothetical protein
MAEGWVALDSEAFEEEVVLPEQLLAYEPAWTPEQNLQAAVLVDAKRCFDSDDMDEHEEALVWFTATESDTFTFNGICESLSLDPKRLLHLLVRPVTLELA